MGWWALSLFLAGFWGIAQWDLDCAPKSRSRTQLDRTLLAEIEAAEDTAQAELREALGGCVTGAEPERCRQETRQRFSAAWTRQKVQIEDKYRRILEEFEVRCRASLTLRDDRIPPVRLSEYDRSGPGRTWLPVAHPRPGWPPSAPTRPCTRSER